ncbi:MAG: acetyltransferase [endosymbiont of Galathealinum brachiosum]|uniref:Acetyltransferase n=1 Tax=endosymbiont of Galathealinum brachiosum TaxID=2200906 RepID=A0A370D9F7_9GAMM|nr:MAG: acetyltransferase [endosymbiont of Galathealinum brachiosum]
MKKIVLIGGGGHCKSCIDVIEQENLYEIVGILDKKELIGEKISGYQYIGTDDDIERLTKKGNEFLITVGQIKTVSIRKRINRILEVNNSSLANVVSPRAYVSRKAKIGRGTIIMHDALINAAVTIGDNCIINSKALIEHEVIIGDFCHISTCAAVNGGAKIGQGTFFGSNAVCKEGAEIGCDSFIKAGEVIKE